MAVQNERIWRTGSVEYSISHLNSNEYGKSKVFCLEPHSSFSPSRNRPVACRPSELSQNTEWSHHYGLQTCRKDTQKNACFTPITQSLTPKLLIMKQWFFKCEKSTKSGN